MLECKDKNINTFPILNYIGPKTGNSHHKVIAVFIPWAIA